MQTIKCGFPKSSIMTLRPLLFILYINDFPNAPELTGPLLFAYDTGIFYSHSSPNCLEPVLNDELQNIDVWQKCNKLSVNIKKTNYIIFKLKQKKLTPAFFSPLELDLYNILTQPNSLGLYRRSSHSETPYQPCM